MARMPDKFDLGRNPAERAFKVSQVTGTSKDEIERVAAAIGQTGVAKNRAMQQLAKGIGQAGDVVGKVGYDLEMQAIKDEKQRIAEAKAAKARAEAQSNYELGHEIKDLDAKARIALAKQGMAVTAGTVNEYDTEEARQKRFDSIYEPLWKEKISKAGISQAQKKGWDNWLRNRRREYMLDDTKATLAKREVFNYEARQKELNEKHLEEGIATPDASAKAANANVDADPLRPPQAKAKEKEENNRAFAYNWVQRGDVYDVEDAIESGKTPEVWQSLTPGQRQQARYTLNGRKAQYEKEVKREAGNILARVQQGGKADDGELTHLARVANKTDDIDLQKTIAKVVASNNYNHQAETSTLAEREFNYRKKVANARKKNPLFDEKTAVDFVAEAEMIDAEKQAILKSPIEFAETRTNGRYQPTVLNFDGSQEELDADMTSRLAVAENFSEEYGSPHTITKPHERAELLARYQKGDMASIAKVANSLKEPKDRLKFFSEIAGGSAEGMEMAYIAMAHTANPDSPIFTHLTNFHSIKTGKGEEGYRIPRGTDDMAAYRKANYDELKGLFKGTPGSAQKMEVFHSLRMKVAESIIRDNPSLEPKVALDRAKSILLNENGPYGGIGYSGQAPWSGNGQFTGEMVLVPANVNRDHWDIVTDRFSDDLRGGAQNGAYTMDDDGVFTHVPDAYTTGFWKREAEGFYSLYRDREFRHPYVNGQNSTLGKPGTKMIIDWYSHESEMRKRATGSFKDNPETLKTLNIGKRR